MADCNNLKREAQAVANTLHELTAVYQRALGHDRSAAADALAGMQIASRELAGLQQEMISQGCFRLPPPPTPPPIRILIVMDGVTTFLPSSDPSDVYFSPAPWSLPLRRRIIPSSC